MDKKLLFLLLICFNNAFTQVKDTIEVSRGFKTILIFQDLIADRIIGNDLSFIIDSTVHRNRFSRRMLKLSYEELAVEKENYTNLTVITETGNLYEFILKLTDYPKQLTWYLNDDMVDLNIEKRGSEHKIPAILEDHYLENESQNSYTDSDIKPIIEKLEPKNDTLPLLRTQNLYENDRIEYFNQMCSYISNEKPKIRRFFARRDGVFLWLKGVYYKQNEIYVSLKIENGENIDFDINFIKCFTEIVYKRVTKQKIPITSDTGLVYRYKVPEKVKGNTENHFVLVFRKITLDKNTQLLLELDEESGNRNLSMRFGKDIINNPISF